MTMSESFRRSKRTAGNVASVGRLTLTALTVVVLVTDHVAVAIGPNHPRYAKLTACRDSRRDWAAGTPQADQEMSSCLKELLMAVGPRYRAGQGIPELDIEPEDPLSIKFAELNVPTLNIQGNVSNANFFGMASSLTEANTDVQISTASKRGQIQFRMPSIRGSGDFALSVDFLTMLFPGADVGSVPVVRGKLSATFENMQGTLFLILGKSADPRKGLEVRQAGMRTKFDKIKLDMVPTFDGSESEEEKRQQQALVSLMNAVSQIDRVKDEIIAKIEPFIVTFVTKMKYRLLSKGFDHIENL